jgi:hypothetical protein
MGKRDESSLIDELLKVLKNIGLNAYWLLAASSLAAQEVAVKKKLDELGVPYGEEDFQAIAEKLTNAMKERKIAVPEILLSISRSYRHIRAKIMHMPQARLDLEEAKAIFYNTEALIRTLFKEESSLEISEFIQSISKSSLRESLDKFGTFNAEKKRWIIEGILDKFLEEDKINECFLKFLKESIKFESGDLQVKFLDILINRTLVAPLFIREKLLRIIAELTELGSIKEFLKEGGRIEQLIRAFEASDSFEEAAVNAAILLNLSSFLNEEQVNRIVDASLSNDQIRHSWGAKHKLERILILHKDKIQENKLRKFYEASKEL